MDRGRTAASMATHIANVVSSVCVFDELQKAVSTSHIVGVIYIEIY